MTDACGRSTIPNATDNKTKKTNTDKDRTLIIGQGPCTSVVGQHTIELRGFGDDRVGKTKVAGDHNHNFNIKYKWQIANDKRQTGCNDITPPPTP